jgi:hypothetical protein
VIRIFWVQKFKEKLKIDFCWKNKFKPQSKSTTGKLILIISEIRFLISNFLLQLFATTFLCFEDFKVNL